MQPIARPEWTRVALCRTRPDDWWDTGDDGNRLAILLCRRACPVLGECAAGDDQPCGVVRAGVAYSDRGRPLPMCPCGRPVTRRRPGSDLCLVCAPPAVEIRLPS